MSRSFAPYLLLVALLILPRVAAADVRAEARRQFREGMALIEAGKYEPGIQALEAAYDLKPHPAVLYNIGRAYVDAGKLTAAIDYFKRYVEYDPDDRDAVEGTIAVLEERISSMQAQAAASLREAELAKAELAKEEATRTLGPGATIAEVEVLERIMVQVEALAEASESPALFNRVEELRRVVADLRQRPLAGDNETRLAEALDAEPPPLVEPPLGPAIEPVATAPLALPSPEVVLPETEDVYASKVVSASRFARTPLDAPNSTTIVTAQDIRLSGLTNVPDLLRRAAGLEVMTLTPGDTQVSIRGLNQRLSNKVLVLVNGRSLYLDFIGATLWQALPLFVESIERIEIIRGPASAIYGADAVTGVINIVLREPGEGESSAVIGGGNANTGRGTASLTGVAGGIAYRVTGGFERTNQYSLMVDPDRVDLGPYTKDPNLGLQSGRFSADLRLRPARGWSLRGGTAVATTDLTFQGISRLRELYTNDAFFSQTYAQLDTPFGVSARVFWNLLRNDGKAVNVPIGGQPIEFGRLTNNALDGEVTYAKELVNHFLAAGVSYRFKSIDWDWIGQEKREHHFSIFLEDTLRIGDHVLVAISGRLDRHPLLPNVEISPRASVVLRPTDGIAVRALAGSAFRKPTFLESYLDLEIATPIRGITSFGVGNTNLRPERLYSFELGYAQEALDILSLEANGYYNLLTDQIVQTRVNRYDLASYPGYIDSVAGFPVGDIQFENEEVLFQQLGAELGVRLNPLRGLDVYANYSLHQTRPFHADEDLGGREDDHRTSTHKVNAGIQYRSMPGLDLSLDAHWVTDQVWVEQVPDETTGTRFEAFRVPSYVLVNARIGYRMFDDRLELGLVGTNLLNQLHRQHPFGQRIGLRLLATTAVKF